MVGLGALVGVSLLIGGVMSLVALGAANVAGVAGNGADGSASARPTLYIPSPSADGSPKKPEETDETEASEEPAEPPEPAEPEATKPEREITLTASPQTVGSMERINLDGSYRGGNGATLQVQRREGERWVDFPVSATVRGGSFSTYVQTGRSGENRFRVIDKSTEQKSKPVTVTIR